MGRGAEPSLDRFTRVFGTGRGNVGERDAFAGRKTPAATRYMAQLGALASSGEIENALLLLRERGLADSSVQPLVEGITSYALEKALDEDWLRAAGRFCQISHLHPSRMFFSVLDPAGSEAPPVPVVKVGGTIEKGALLWNDAERQQYETALRKWLRADLERGIAHLRGRSEVDTWLVTSAVQGALVEVASDTLTSPAGEDALLRALGEDRYQEVLTSAHEHELDGVHAVVDRDELIRTLQPLLPSQAGIYDLGDAEEEFEINSYNMAIAYGLERLKRNDASRT